MKITKYIAIFTVLFCIGQTTSAQMSRANDEYTKNLSYYFCRGDFQSEFKKLLQDHAIGEIIRNPQLFGLESLTGIKLMDKGEEMIQNYVDNIFVLDCADIIANQVREKASEQEMQQYADFIKDNSEALKSALVWQKPLYDSKFLNEVFKDFCEISFKGIDNNYIKKWNSKNPPKLNSSYSPSYQEKFRNLEIVSTYISAKSQKEWESLSKNASSSKFANAIRKDIETNFPIHLLNKMSNPINEDELQVLVQFENLPVFKTIDSVMDEYDDETFSQQIYIRSSGWLMYYGNRPAMDEFDALLNEYATMRGSSATTMSKYFHDSFVETTKEIINDQSEIFPLVSTSTFAQQCVDDYEKQGFYSKDIINLFLGSNIRKKISTEELREAIELTNKPEILTALKHEREAISGEELKKQSQELATNYLKSLFSDSSPKNAKAVKCPKTYKTAFNNYVEKSGGKEQITSLLSGMTKTLDNQNPLVGKYIKDMMQYLEKNMFVLMLNVFYENVTEQELEVLTTYVENPTIYKMQNVSTESIQSIFSSPEKTMEKLSYKYLGYLFYYKTK